LAGNAVINVVLELAYVVGPPIAALLLLFVDASVVIGLDALTFGTMALIYRLAIPTKMRRKRVPRTASRSAGFGAIGRSPMLGVFITVSFLFFLCFGPVSVALPVYVSEDLGASAAVLAGYFTAFGIGGFLGAFGAGYLRRWPMLWTSLMSVLGVGVLLLPLGTPIPTVVAWISFGVAGLFWGPFPSTTTAYFQHTAPSEDLAAVLAARSALQAFALPAGALLAAPVIAVLGAQKTLLLSGGLIITVALVGAVLLGTLNRRQSAAQNESDDAAAVEVDGAAPDRPHKFLPTN
jgi:hypothetical protein